MHMDQLVFLISGFILITCAAAANITETKHGCEPKCGNVKVPYPFGIGSNCSIAPWANITCKKFFNPPKPFIYGLEVVELLPTEVRIKNNIATTCFKQSRKVRSGFDMYGTPYTFLSTKNKLTAIGCDILALASFNNGRFSSGCAALCNNVDDLVEKTCSGIGCCQSSIPQGLKGFNLKADRVNGHKRNWSYCSTAFLVEEGKYSFKVSDLVNTSSLYDVPIVMNFAIGNQTCEAAEQNTTTFACKDNSYCYNSVDGTGYLCNCSEGYKGNPYLDQGCQDVNECEKNPCKGICTNTQGSYQCSCPDDSDGDGTKDGSGCTKKNVKLPVLKNEKLPVLKLALGLGFGFLFLLAGGSLLYLGIQQRKHFRLKEKFFRKNGGILLKQQISSHETGVESTKIFTVKELKMATNNYDQHRIIGEGGSGTVYKGILPDLRIVAIKKSKVIDGSQLGQFINEVVVLTQINHRNVVKLIGCCLETEVPLLVYEFVPNGTLYHHLHNQVGAFSSLSWQDRLRIAAETAGALAYLHSAATVPIIHRDVKSANILLDDNYTAKVADFGASRLNPFDQTQISTLVQGTMGYLDPEYFHTSQLTEKSDVYSFGVVLAELLTGEMPLSFRRSENQRNLATYFIQSIKENYLFQVLEPGIANEGKTEQVHVVAQLAKRCLNVTGDGRPSMKEVAAELEGLRGFEKQSSILQSKEEKMSSTHEEAGLYAIPPGSFSTEGTSGQYGPEKETVWPMLNVPR